MHDSKIYFRQLLAGRQVAVQHPVAGQMRNFMYLIGDPKTRKALVVDPAWDVTSLLETANGDGYEITGALISHYHPDHVETAKLVEDARFEAKLYKTDMEGTPHWVPRQYGYHSIHKSDSF